MHPNPGSEAVPPGEGFCSRWPEGLPIARIPLYDDSWDCGLASFEDLGFHPEAVEVEEGKLRVYRGLEYVEIEEGTHDGRPVLVLRGSTGLMQSAASGAVDSDAVAGQPRQEVVDVARTCGPGMIGAS